VSDTQRGQDYENLTRIQATPDAVFDAITTSSGLSAWWTRADGRGETGGELEFFMRTPEPLVIHVDSATRPSRVEWTVTDCPFLTDWVGTRPVFAISAVDGDESDLHFIHHGLSAQLECFDMCMHSWNHYMSSLRDHLEGDAGSPMGSDADNTRRDAEKSAGIRR